MTVYKRKNSIISSRRKRTPQFGIESPQAKKSAHKGQFELKGRINGRKITQRRISGKMYKVD